MASPIGNYSSLFVDGNGKLEPEDDIISLTSTLDSEHEPDEEFVVDAVLAERPHENPTEEGEMQYLIRWENYPLGRSSWESRGNLSDELYEHWRKQRALEIQGRHRPFDVGLYEDALADAQRRAAERHMLRNARRQELNLPLTEPFPAGFVPTAMPNANNEDSDSSVEAMEVGIEMDQPDHEPSKRRIRQTTFKGIKPSRTTQHKRPKQPLSSGWQGTARNPNQPGTASAANASAKTTHVALSASLASKFAGKRLKATRTIVSKPVVRRPSTAATTTTVQNFRRPRTSLKEVMMDSSKSPKLMTNMRQVNILKKKGRELNDSAPANPSAIPAGYFITPNPPQHNTSANNKTNQSLISSPSDNSTNASTNHAHNLSDARVNHSSDLCGPSLVPSAIKSLTAGSKNARNRKTVRFVEESVSDGSNNTKYRPGPPVRKVSLQSYQQRTVFHTIVKTTTFGVHASQPVCIEFQTLPRLGEWLSHFTDINHIHFGVVCTAVDFFSGNSPYDNDAQAKLASGKLGSSNEADAIALSTVASNLKSSGSGFYVAYPSYSVLVYPEYEAWAPLLNLSDPSLPDRNVFRYLIFRPKSVGPEHHLDLPVSSSNATSADTSSAALRIRLMKEVASIDYNLLLAPSAREEHVFFLMFHPTETSVYHALSLWLRACRPECQIFHSLEPGAWRAYQEETDSGAVIIHESVEKNVRSLPGLWDMLKHGAHTFWRFSSSDHEAAPETLAAESHRAPRMPQQLGLAQLFPAGRAFLVTPSFAVSQPVHLLEFLEWFKKRAAVAPCILVACTDFPRYLFDVAMEKSIGNEIQEYQEARVRAWKLIAEFSDAKYFKYCGFSSAEEPAEDIRKFVWADALIAPDDEQSLLNWYAAWSLTRLDTYRKFYVLGSSAKDIQNSHRKVRVPNYLPEVTNDPDKMPDPEKPTATPAHILEFRSRLFGGDQSSDFQPFFDSFNHLRHTSSFWLFFKAISWYNMDMAEQHGDPYARNYGCYRDWLKSFPRFWKKVNTLIGFFYTTEADWDGTALSKPQPTMRHPWIAMLRPVNHHETDKYFGDLELLIWDCTAQLPKVTRPAHLLPMQRKLISYVREELPKTPKHEDYRLQRVWVSNLDAEVEVDPSCPVDVTCKTMQAFVDGKVGRARFLPPHDNALVNAGWRLLREVDDGPPGFPRISADDEEPGRLIFHPPQGNCVSCSACTNDLYDAAFEARMTEPSCTEFVYRYQPTLQWFQDLEDEGRLYNHIDVDSWEHVWKDLHSK